MFIWLQMPSFYAVIWHFSSRLALFAQAGLPDRSPTAKVGMPSRSPKGAGWCPHPELNWDQRFRKQRSLPSCRYQENTINIGRSSFCNDSVTPNLIPPSDTVSMKTKNPESESLWTKAPVANLVRYEPSGI